MSRVDERCVMCVDNSWVEPEQKPWPPFTEPFYQPDQARIWTLHRNKVRSALPLHCQHCVGYGDNPPVRSKGWRTVAPQPACACAPHT